MKAAVQLSSHISLQAGVALAAVICLSVTQFSCKEPHVAFAPYTVYNCRDRTIMPDRTSSATGVDRDTIIVCGGFHVRWREKNGEQWQVDFVASPFQQGEKTIKKGDKDPSPVLVLNDDTAFKYTITVDGKQHDPQIIIMGG